MFAAKQQLAAIALRSVSKSYGRHVALRDVSLDVNPGEIFGFLGVNGAGKTTTIRILLDLLRPSSGSASIFGKDCRAQSLETRANVGYLPAEIAFYPDVTGEQALDLTARLSAAPVAAEYRRRVLDTLALSRDDLRRPCREYSTGMKRKLGLVQALQMDPPLLILDEPTEGLDPLMQRALHALLSDLRARGRTVFMSSHVMSEVERLCDRIAVIRAGTLVLVSTVDDARRSSGRIARIQFTRTVNTVALPASMSYIESTPERWTLRVEGDVGPLLPLLATLPVRDMEIAEPSLEDVVSRFYAEEAT